MMETKVRLKSAAISDRGLSEKRPQNEDSFLQIDRCGVYAVADGVGGAQAGEVASQMAVELLGEAFSNLAPGNDAESVMRAAIEQSNSAIYQMAHELSQLSNMATTLVAIHISGEIATIGHVGDSRLYRVDPEGTLYRETDDHSMVGEEVRAGRMTEEQAENHPSRNIISRAIGAEASVNPDLKTIMIEPGTVFLLCSDGITRHVADAEIKGVLTFGGSPEDICRYLKDLCFERGAEDNLTAVVVKVVEERKDTYFGTNEDVLDIEEPTLATARPAIPDSDVESEDDLLLELETRELPTSGSNVGIEPSPNIEVPDNDQMIDTGGTHETGSGSSFVSSDDSNPAISHSEQVPESADKADDRVYSAFDSLDATGNETSGLNSILISIGFLVIGSLIGLGVYHFVLVPSSVDQPNVPITEMKTANIPLSAFEENRRNVDKDPGGYITRFGSSPQDAEDHYLIGRAYLLTGDYANARKAFNNSLERLAEADPINAKTLAADLAVGLAVTSDTTIQSILKKELDNANRPTVNTNSNR